MAYTGFMEANNGMEAKMYTYLITFELYVESLGMWCEGYYRTTDDAVEIHRSILAKRTAKGEMRNAKVTPIAV
jgi:hypothetical protein